MSRKRKTHTKELTRYDKLIAVCLYTMEELADHGLLKKASGNIGFTEEGKAEINKWRGEENFTEEEIQSAMNDLFNSGTVKMVP